MFERQARVVTPKAQYYLYQLCKHFSHKVTAEWNETSGSVDFVIGQCLLNVDENNLQVYCQSDDLANLQDVMDTIKRHFDRFAYKEACELIWS